MGSVAVGERNKMLNALTGRATYTKPAGVFGKLHTGDPGAAGTANAATETTRQAVTFGSAASVASIASTADTVWTALAASETISWISFWSASTAGVFLGSDDLTVAQAVNAGGSLTITSGSLTISITGTKILEAERNAMLNSWAGRTDYTAKTSNNIKLHIGAPGAAGTTNPASETTRKVATYGSDAAAGSISITASSVWTSYPAVEQLTDVSIWDNISAGNYLYQDTLAAAQNMNIGGTFTMPLTTGLTITLT